MTKHKKKWYKGCCSLCGRWVKGSPKDIHKARHLRQMGGRTRRLKNRGIDPDTLD